MRQLWVGCLLVWGASVRLHAAELSDADARARLTQQLDTTRDFQADFSQTVIDSAGQVVEQSSGHFWLIRPDRFRWEYTSPWPRVLLMDGESIWLYDQQLDQVTVRDAGPMLAQTPAGLLAGNGDLLKQNAVTGVAQGDALQVTLTPLQAGGDFKQITMNFAAGQLQRLELIDQFQQTTRIQFEDALVNSPAEASLFQFAVPENADLIDERAG